MKQIYPGNPYRYLRLCAWGGPAMLLGTILFWGVLGQNIPPYSGALDARAFADQYISHIYSIRAGMICTLAITPLYFLWGLAITKVMEKVERDNNILSQLQLWGAGFTTVVFYVACAVWLASTYRPETYSPETLQTLYDLGWIAFDMPYALTTMQMVAIGVCFLSDRRPVPLVPKWVCWLSIWAGFSFFLEVMMPWFRSGPFARSGTLNYWIEFSAFFVFMAAVSAYIVAAVARLEREHANAAATTSGLKPVTANAGA
ncbi:MAG: hypothetical protein JWR07_3274 [Nevskia sp.]|nr:hypothetical protein [Nevskia sp.]